MKDIGERHKFVSEIGDSELLSEKESEEVIEVDKKRKLEIAKTEKKTKST